MPIPFAQVRGAFYAESWNGLEIARNGRTGVIDECSANPLGVLGCSKSIDVEKP